MASLERVGKEKLSTLHESLPLLRQAHRYHFDERSQYFSDNGSKSKDKLDVLKALLSISLDAFVGSGATGQAVCFLSAQEVLPIATFTLC